MTAERFLAPLLPKSLLAAASPLKRWHSLLFVVCIPAAELAACARRRLDSIFIAEHLHSSWSLLTLLWPCFMLLFRTWMQTCSSCAWPDPMDLTLRQMHSVSRQAGIVPIAAEPMASSAK